MLKMRLLFLFFITTTIFSSPPTINDFMRWSNSTEEYKILSIEKIYTETKSEIYIALIAAYSRGECCNPITVLLLPEEKRTIELYAYELMRTLKVVDLNSDGVSEIELTGGFGSEGYYDGVKKLITIDQKYQSKELWRSNFSDDCGTGRDSCHTETVEWHYQDRTKDSILDLVEKKTSTISHTDSYGSLNAVDTLQSNEKVKTIFTK